MSALGTHLYQCTSWCCCERLHSASVNFFLRLFQLICPFHDDRFNSTPAHTALGVQQLLTQNLHDPHALPSLFIPSHSKRLFICLFPWRKKSLHRKCVPHVEEMKQTNKQTNKTAEALKAIKISKSVSSKTVWAVEKSLYRCIAWNREYFEGDWNLNM